MAAGVALLAAYGAGMLHRTLGSSAAISSFEASETAAPNDNSEGQIHFGLWSPMRIKAYRQSLTLLKGEPMGVLSINRLQIKAAVFSGTDDLVLNRGLGWVPSTPRPGEPGNSGLAGHRDGFFRALKDVEVGDTVDLRTPRARSTFRVDEIEIVTPKDVRVLRPRANTSLTLITCYPFYFVGDAPKRFIVHAKLEKQVPINSVQAGGPSKR